MWIGHPPSSRRLQMEPATPLRKIKQQHKGRGEKREPVGRDYKREEAYCGEEKRGERRRRMQRERERERERETSSSHSQPSHTSLVRFLNQPQLEIWIFQNESLMSGLNIFFGSNSITSHVRGEACVQ